MINHATSRYWSAAVTGFALIALSMGVGPWAHGQTARTAINSPVLQGATVTKTGSDGPEAIADNNGHHFNASYDQANRLVSLDSVQGVNAHDLHIDYRSDGRIRQIRFGNQYAIRIGYDPKGRQEVSDSFGDTLIRVNEGSGLFVTQMKLDPRGILDSTLKQLQALLALFPSAANLSTVTELRVAP